MPEELQKKRLSRTRQETKHHLIAFIVSIILTILAFYAVPYEGNPRFVIPFIVVIAAIQAAFQLYIWMHMKDEEHRFPTMYIYVAVLVVLVTILAFLFMVWW